MFYLSKSSNISSIITKYPLVIIFLMMLLPISYTVPHVMMAPENPDGEIPFPENITSESEGFVLIVLDGVGRDYFLDEDLMPKINAYRSFSATVDITTGPLTLSATCISEMMTGVPNAPINGLRNFDLNHPGKTDPWLLASTDSRYKVGIVGSYVMGNLYGEFNDIYFENTFKGHSDYYEGDKDTLEVASSWLNKSQYNVMAVHFSGPDKVGHTWGADSEEYETKLTHVDSQVSDLLDHIPKNWSVVITADHGMTDMGTHGSSEDITRDVAAVISGPQVIPKSVGESHQRDISAAMALILGLPFPVQLHGQIPLEIFDYNETESQIINQWNWEAAYHRQIFFNEKEGVKDSDLSIHEPNWNVIPSDGEFSRTSDVYVSIFMWIMIATIAITGIGLSRKEIVNDWKIFSGFILSIALLVLSHAMLKYSAMIPRAIGGLCAVWLVGWSLRGTKDEPNGDGSSIDLDKILNNPSLWLSISIIIGLVFWSLLIAVVSSLFLYAILYSINSSFDRMHSTESKHPSYVPWIVALVCMTFGSIRLWYGLIPFFFILIGLYSKYHNEKKSTAEKLPIISMLMLSFFAVFFVHRRIYGEHYILEAVETGWPNSLQSIIISSLLLILTAVISVIAQCNEERRKKALWFSIWLTFGLLVSALESTYVDIFALLSVACVFSVGIYYYTKRPNSPQSTEYTIAALSMLVLLTWGAWSVFATVLILTCAGKIWNIIRINTDAVLQNNTSQAWIAMGIFPWIIWILWWTLLGQVNGLQTCFEGICPHPRELDPGSVIVRGGYVGSRQDPNLYWMIFMASSPIILTSIMVMRNLQKSGLNLYPYIIFQSLIILGCFSVIGFSPEYPRLVFSLTWNIFFAAFQLISASFVHIVWRSKSHNLKSSSLAQPIASV